jgi:hypothetical protein
LAHVRSRSVVLFVVVLLQFVVALYPFDLSVHREYVNDVHRTADGGLRTGDHNRAVTPAAPAWLPEAIASERLTVDLVVRTHDLDQGGSSGPAHIMALSEGEWYSNLTIGQQGRHLLVWLRRPGTDNSGEPGFLVPGVFTDTDWREIQVVIDETLSVTVDGRKRLVEALPLETFAIWDPGYRLTIGDDYYGRLAWRGDLRRAEVRTATNTVDYLEPGALEIPETYARGPYRPWEPVFPLGLDNPMNELVHSLLFVPVGVVLRNLGRPRLGHMAVIAVAVALAFVVQSAKMLMVGRHPSMADIPWMALGALVGSLLYTAAVRAGTVRVIHRARRTEGQPRLRWFA